MSPGEPGVLFPGFGRTTSARCARPAKMPIRRRDFDHSDGRTLGLGDEENLSEDDEKLSSEDGIFELGEYRGRSGIYLSTAGLP